MKPIKSYIVWHYGDHMMYLNFIRRVAKAMPDQEFVHYAYWNLLDQLREVVEDIPNIKLAQLERDLPPDAANVWIGADNYWYAHPRQKDFVVFTLDWYAHLAKRLGVTNYMLEKKDLLFDYPAILKPISGPNLPPTPFDVLVISSAPASGQLRDYDHAMLINMAARMADKGLKVIVTTELPKHIKNVYSTVSPGQYLSITQIGQLSLHCHTILMVSTGPSWPTFNIWNQDTIKNRIILLTDQRVELSPNTRHCKSAREAEVMLKESGLL